MREVLLARLLRVLRNGWEDVRQKIPLKAQGAQGLPLFWMIYLILVRGFGERINVELCEKAWLSGGR